MISKTLEYTVKAASFLSEKVTQLCEDVRIIRQAIQCWHLYNRHNMSRDCDIEKAARTKSGGFGP